MFLNDFFLWVQELPFLSTWRGDIFSCLKLTAWHNRHGCGGPGLKWVGPTWACPPPPVGRLVGLLLLLLVGPHTHTHTLGPCCPVSPLLSCWPRPAAAYSAPAWPGLEESGRLDPGQPEDSGSTRRQLPGSLETGGGGSAAPMSRRYRVVRTPVINRGPADTAASLSRDSAWEPGWLRLVSTILICFRLKYILGFCGYNAIWDLHFNNLKVPSFPAVSCWEITFYREITLIFLLG